MIFTPFMTFMYLPPCASTPAPGSDIYTPDE